VTIVPIVRRGQPFAIIGVNSDTDRNALKEVLKKEGITWRSFWDGGSTSGLTFTAPREFGIVVRYSFGSR